MKQQRYIFLRDRLFFRSVAERMEFFYTFFLLFSTLVSLGQGISDQRYCLHKTRLTIFVNLHKYPGVPLAGMLGSQLVEVEERNYFFNLQYFIIVVENVLRDPCYEARLYYQLEREFLELEVTNVKTQFEKVFENLSQYITRIEMKDFVEFFKKVEGRREIIL